MKKILIGILIVLILLLGAAWAYLLLNGAPENLNEIKSIFGGAGTQFPESGAGAPPSNVPREEEPPQQEIRVHDRLVKLASRPIAGAVTIQTDAGGVVRYIEKGTGAVYEISLQGGTVSRIGNEAIARVISAVWSPDGTHVLLIQESAGVRGETLLGTYKEGNLTTQPLAAPENVAFSKDSKRLYYTEPSATFGTTGFSLDLETNDISTLFSLPFREAVIVWDLWKNADHYVYTKAASGFIGFLYKIEGTQLRKIDEAIHLTASRFDADTMIVNKDTGQGPYGLLYTLETGGGVFTSLQTLKEKCGQARGTLWCAANDAMNTYPFPVSWYQGTVSYADALYTINRETGESTRVVDLESLSREQIDVIDFSTSDDGRLLFRNKRDDSLWLYNPTN